MKIFRIFMIIDLVLDLIDRIRGYGKPQRERRRAIRAARREDDRRK